MLYSFEMRGKKTYPEMCGVSLLIIFNGFFKK